MSSETKKGTNQDQMERSGSNSSTSIDLGDSNGLTEQQKVNRLQEKFVPKAFRGQKPDFVHSDAKHIRVDLNALKNWTAYSQMFIVVSGFVKITILLFIGCTKDKESDGQNTTIVNITTDSGLFSSDDGVKTLITKKQLIDCVTDMGFLVVFLCSAIYQLCSLLFYCLHVIEVYPNVPWLLIGWISNIFWTFVYLIISTWMITIGGWMILAGLLGYIDTIVYSVLVCIKCKLYRSGRAPQDSTYDPDGDLERQKSPNFRFKRNPSDGEEYDLNLKQKSGSLKDIV